MSPAPVCDKCGLEATSYATVAGKKLHPACFTCAECNTELAGKPFIPGDVFRCQECYKQKMAPRCGHCDEPILGPHVKALGKCWCPDHFLCGGCAKPVSGQCFKHNDNPYCKACYIEEVNGPCAKCGEVIDGDVLEAFGKRFHADCFRCTEDHPIPGGSSFHIVGDNKIYCPEHFSSLVEFKCGSCLKVIEGEYLKFGDIYLHPRCLHCSKCKNDVKLLDSRVINGELLCKPCATTTDGKAEAKTETKAVAEPKEAKETPKDKDDEKMAIKRYLTFDTLKDNANLPPDVDVLRKEDYLDDDLFKSVFNITRAEFLRLPKWRRNVLKRGVGLF